MNLHAYKRISLADIVPSEENPRTHSAQQVEQIRRSIREFGFTNPLLVDEDNRLIAGHGRLQAAQAEGLSDLPAIVVAGLTEAQKRALVIADNQLALNAGWDSELLKLNLEALQQDGFDLSLVGFSEEEMASILTDRTMGLTDPDDAPEPPANPVSRLGDTWTLGRHRTRCGDATKAEDVTALLDGVEPHLMVTDPPYGVDYDPAWRNRAFRADGTPIGAFAIGTVSNDTQSDWAEAWALFPGDVAYCWHAGLHASNTQLAFEACGFALRSQIIWAKSMFAIGRGHYHVQHEPCFYLVRKGSTGHWVADRKQTTLWQIDKPRKSETGHSTQKPVECMKRPIENNSSPGQAVYDPFSGSGTTIIAGEMTGRAIYAMEISPAYVDVAILRWQAFTGKTATLEGRSFEEVKVARTRPQADGQADPGGGGLRSGGSAPSRHRAPDRDQHSHAPKALQTRTRHRKGQGQRPSGQESVSDGH